MTEQLRAWRNKVGELSLEHVRAVAVKLRAARLQQRAVRGVAQERMAELVSRALARGAALDESRRPQSTQALRELGGLRVARGGEQRLREAAPEPRGDLGQLAGGAEAVEPGQQQAVQGGRKSAGVVALAGGGNELFDEQ